MRQIDQKSINILYDPIGQLTNKNIDKDFTQSYWLALQFVRPYEEKQTQTDFYRGMPQASHGKMLL